MESCLIPTIVERHRSDGNSIGEASHSSQSDLLAVESIISDRIAQLQLVTAVGYAFEDSTASETEAVCQTGKTGSDIAAKSVA